MVCKSFLRYNTYKIWNGQQVIETSWPLLVFNENEFCRMEEPKVLDDKFQVIFQLRWSAIFDKSKVLLKPLVSVILYFPLNCAKHNITRRKPNITAQQYNLPKANITEKRHPKMSFFTAYCLCSFSLNILHFLSFFLFSAFPIWEGVFYLILFHIIFTWMIK